MKTKSLVVIAALAAFMGIAHAEEAKGGKKGKGPTPEQLEKYDKDKDGKLSAEEKAEMRKDQPAKEKKQAGGKAKEPTPEQLEKYDKDKDGKLSKEEKTEMRKDQPAKQKPAGK